MSDEDEGSMSINVLAMITPERNKSQLSHARFLLMRFRLG